MSSKPNLQLHTDYAKASTIVAPHRPGCSSVRGVGDERAATLRCLLAALGRLRASLCQAFTGQRRRKDRRPVCDAVQQVPRPALGVPAFEGIRQLEARRQVIRGFWRRTPACIPRYEHCHGFVIFYRCSTVMSQLRQNPLQLSASSPQEPSQGAAPTQSIAVCAAPPK